MKLLVTAKMTHGTFPAKFNPLSQINKIEKIYVVRKEMGFPIEKIEYLVLPKIARFPLVNLLITPIIILYQAIKLKPSFIVGYHFVPHAIFAFIAGKLTRTPIIFCQTGGECQTYLKKPFVSRVVKFLLNGSYRFNVPGKQSYQFWIENGIKKEKISILHSTINTEVFTPANSANFNYDILYVGGLNERKRVDWIIKGVADLQKENVYCKLAIVGDGPLMSNLKQLVTNLNISEQVEFLGFQKNVKQFHDKAKIFVMTSDMEGLPVALMEAMSCEKLVVAPSVDNIPTVLIDNETGFSFSKDDFSNFLDKLRNAVVNFNSLENLRKNARKKIVDEYSYPVAVEKWKRILGINKEAAC